MAIKHPGAVNNYSKSPKEVCFGIYDFDPKASLKTWLEITVDLFKELGLTPTKVDLAGENASKSGKTISFKAGWKRLEGHNFQGFSSVAMIATPQGELEDDEIYLAYAGCNFTATGKPAFALCIDEGLLEDFDLVVLNSIYIRYYDLLKPKYGFCTKMAWQKGPSWYVDGLAYSSPGSKEGWRGEEAAQIRYWSSNYHKFYKAGDFRDIYEINYLTPEHLSLDIGEGQKLREAIGKERGFGTLEQLAKELYSWSLTAEEIEPVRQKLASTSRVLGLKRL
jgi:hypothetical protein